jgi:Viral BACON domain
MGTCEYCGADIPDHASFCGRCGQAPSRVTGPNLPTRSSLPPFDARMGDPFATVASPSQLDLPPIANSSQGMSGPSSPQYQRESNPSFPDYHEPEPAQMPPAISAEEEEERRRRAALLGLGFVGGLAREVQPGNVPMVQGTPQMSGVPMVSGAPQMGNAPMAQAMPGTAGNPFTPGTAGNSLSSGASSPPHPANPAHPTHPTHPTPPTHPTHPTHPTPNPAPGCAPAWLIIVSAIILIITSIITTAFTILTPALSLSGSGAVPLGGALHLHGSHFIPGSSVTLTLDGTTPLYVSSPHFHAASLQAMGEVWMLAEHVEQLPTGSNVVRAGGDGSFDVTIPIGANWKPGQHTIRAAENISPRSAELTFTVVGTGTTPTPMATATATATTTATVTPTASPSPSTSPTPTSIPTGLSCINPGTLTLGPVSEGYNQAASSVVTLCTNGSGVVNWTASWDQNASPWLKLDRTSGQIRAPAQQQVTMSASASGLKVGNYSATVTFNDQQDNTSEMLTVSFTVQAGCVNAMPTTLNFTGEAGVSDPSTQTVSVTNCGTLPATWSASVKTNSGGNWLSVSTSGGTLKSNTAQNVTVTASNLGAKLSAGTYTGQITFAVGSTQSIVNVTLTVQAAPTLVVESPNPPTFYANQNCSYNSTGSYWICIASISNSSSSLSLNWTSSSSGIAGITFKPASGTLGPNQGTRVQIIVPANNCQAQTTLTFSGPANSVNITWYCTIIS